MKQIGAKVMNAFKWYFNQWAKNYAMMYDIYAYRLY